MTEHRTRSLLILVAVAIILGLVWDFYPLPDARERLQAIPLQGVGFSGTEVPLTDLERELMGDAQARKILYLVKGRRFMLTVLDGSRDRNAVHDPSYCFRGAGWSIEGEGELPLPGGNGKIITMEKGGSHSSAALWFSTSDEIFASVPRYWFTTAVRRLTLGTSSSEPVLVIVRPLDGLPVNWSVLAFEFIALLEF
jgi:hypothetical protein